MRAQGQEQRTGKWRQLGMLTGAGGDGEDTVGDAEDHAAGVDGLTSVGALVSLLHVPDSQRALPALAHDGHPARHAHCTARSRHRTLSAWRAWHMACWVHSTLGAQHPWCTVCLVPGVRGA